ncbi:hypothetical protein E27107_70029 [Elizabethkingia anophelis]|nr:hypothetical protein E18064_190035 [Elizabethkingia anophelis]CDN79678.1 hypothetical protein E27107_70029 [Elizabethkingia anophelis]
MVLTGKKLQEMRNYIKLFLTGTILILLSLINELEAEYQSENGNP